MSMLINPFVFGPTGEPSGLAVFWMAGAEHEAAVSEKWNGTDPTSIDSGVTDAHGRVYSTASDLAQHLFGATLNPVTARVRFRPTTNSTDTILSLRDGSSNVQMQIQYLNTGAFRVQRLTTTLATSSAGLMSIDNWYEAELITFIDNTTGSFTARLWDNSGTLLSTLTGSSVDTQGSGTPDVVSVFFQGSIMNAFIDEVAVDAAGSPIGRILIATRYPTGNGDLNQWTRGGTDTGSNFDQVDEAVKDTTSYMQSTGADEFDFYGIDITSLGGTMLALQVNALGRSASGTAEFKIALRIGGVTYEDSATQQWTSTTADSNRWAVWSDNPATGNAWTGLETVQVGVKSVTSNARLHQCCAEILVGL